MKNRCWYLLSSKPHQEELAKYNLEEQGYQVYLPMLMREVDIIGKQNTRYVPLFKRYLFILLDYEEDDWAPIRTTLGVSGVVIFGAPYQHRYVSIPENIVSFIKNVEDHQMDFHDDWLAKRDLLQVHDSSVVGLDKVFLMENGLHRSMALIETVGKLQRKVSEDERQLCSGR